SSAPPAPTVAETPLGVVTTEQSPQHEATRPSGAALLFDILHGPGVERLDTASPSAMPVTAPSITPAVREVEPAWPAAAAPAPRVEITIGSIDIIVAPSGRVPAPPSPAVAQLPSVQSLNEYLQSRQ